MKLHLNYRDLSAYVDGEAKRPERIARHLQQCPACAKAHVALLKLSGHLKGVPRPAVVSGFAERVLREIRTRDAKRRPASQPSWQRWGLPLAAAAALLVVGVLMIQDLPQSGGGSAAVETASRSDVLRGALVEGMLETPAVDTTDTAWLFAASNKPEPKPASDTFIQLASMEWDAPVRWDGQRDMGWILGSVAHNDTDIVLSVLTQYARADR